MMLRLLLLSFVTVCLSSITEERCLHHGCKLTKGLGINQLDGLLEDALKESEIKANALLTATWNIKSSAVSEENEAEDGKNSWVKRKKNICEYLKKLNPDILGLQEVEAQQLMDLQASANPSCLTGYEAVGLLRSVKEKNPQFNPILYKKQRQLRFKQTGTFWLSETPNKVGSKLSGATEPRICTWAKFRYALHSKKVTKTSEESNSFSKGLTVFAKLFRGIKMITLKKKKSEKTKWKYFYVINTHLDEKNVNIAKRQITILLQEFRKNIMMDETDIPVLLTGSLSWEDNTVLYDALEDNKWLENSLVKSRKIYPALTTLNLKTSEEKQLVDYIWYRNFKSVLSGTMTDAQQYSDHRPVFGAFLFK